MTKLLGLLGLSSPIMLYVVGAILAAVGLLYWHDRSTAADLKAQITANGTLTEQLKTAGEINAENLAAISRLKAEAERANAAVAEDATKTESRTKAVTKIRSEVSHVALTPADIVGPHTLAAVDGLRRLKASRAADPSPGGAHPNTGAPAVMPR